jgi:hypothetical protein
MNRDARREEDRQHRDRVVVPAQKLVYGRKPDEAIGERYGGPAEPEEQENSPDVSEEELLVPTEEEEEEEE